MSKNYKVSKMAFENWYTVLDKETKTIYRVHRDHNILNLYKKRDVDYVFCGAWMNYDKKSNRSFIITCIKESFRY